MNSTSLVIDSLRGGKILYPSSFELETLVLPVSFQYCFEALKSRIDLFNPDVIISLGQSDKSETITLENLALNLVDAVIDDNDGLRPKNTLISQTGPSHYLSTLPIQGIEGALIRGGIPVKTSQSAGTFVCNYLFYRLMEYNIGTERLCGFIHLPLIPEQADHEEPSLPLKEIERAMSLLLNYIDY